MLARRHSTSAQRKAAPGMNTTDSRPSLDFLRAIVDRDVRAGKNDGRVVTRFPPEPNGYLHIGHAKSICLNFGIAADFAGRCHLRFDDTNPCKEEARYADAMKEDIHWLGFEWGEHLYHASDYYQQLYDYAEQLITAGLAYVCSLSPEQIREYRGTLTEPGRESPDRNRPARGEPRSLPPDAGRRVRRRRVRPAGQDRHGLAQREHARPGAVPDPTGTPPPHRRRVVHLSDVRLRALPSRTRSRGSPTRSARSSSRTTARSTTGCSTSCRYPAIRSRSSSPGST